VNSLHKILYEVQLFCIQKMLSPLCVPLRSLRLIETAKGAKVRKELSDVRYIWHESLYG